MKKPAISLIIAAALALTAVVAAASASAATVLCNENAATCSASHTYPVGTKLEGALHVGTQVQFKGVLTESCGSSTLAGKTTSEVGETVGVEISSLTFSCTSPCKTVEARNLPYSAQVGQTAGGEASMTVTGGTGGGGGLQFSNCSFGTTCVYSVSGLSLTLKGGNPAQLVATEVPLALEEGNNFFCGKSTKMSATYDLTAPKPLFATNGAGRDSVLCRESAVLCPAVSILPAHTTITAKATEPIISFGIFSNQKCASSELTATTNEESGNPLAAQITSLTFSGSCTPCKRATVKGLPYPASLAASAYGDGSGTLTTSAAIEWSECTFGATCVFEFNNVKLSVTGGSPAVIAANRAVGSLGSGNPNYCGSSMTLTATWNVSSPSAFWLTRRE